MPELLIPPPPALTQSNVETREVLSEFLRLFYAKDWVSGTGGGICATVPGGAVLLAPSGVHKERVRPTDFFTVRVEDGAILHAPDRAELKPSECGPIFRAAIVRREAGAVMHSHSLSSVLAGDLAQDGVLTLGGFEMLKGIRGLSNRDTHLVPVIQNTIRESDLVEQTEAVLSDPRFAGSYCILVRDHGAYIWGADLWETKRHAEVYHWLFQGVRARAGDTVSAARASHHHHA